MFGTRTRRGSGNGEPRHKRPSYANVVATLALFLAVAGGTAYAAKHYLITSTRQIKPSVVAKLKGKAGARGATGPAGAPGKAGPAGPAGSTGSTGSAAFGSLTYVTASGALGTGIYDEADVVATCPAGDSPTGGGVETPSIYDHINDSMPYGSPPTGWRVNVTHAAGYTYADTITAWAVCAPVAPTAGP